MAKRGLTDALNAANVTDTDGVFFGDEMRIGLIGQVRRVWCSVGVKVVQPREFTYEWSYLNLAVNGLTGHLFWAWGDNMKAITIAPIVEAWADQGLHTIIWDRAQGHRGQAYHESDVVRIEQPPYAPELNPAERIFQFLRGKVEGIVYGSIAAKTAVVEQELAALARDPQAVMSIAGWQWIHDAVDALQPPP